MQRTKPPVNNTTPLQGDPVARADLAKQVGVQYEGERDIYKALGYPRSIVLRNYVQSYERQDIARKINDAPVQATWRGDIRVTDSDEDSPFDQAWEELAKKLRLWNKISRFDKLVGLGQYAVLLLGFSDVTDEKDFQNPVTGSPDLMYVYPYHQLNAGIERYDNSPSSDRYGMPELYRINVSSGEFRNDQQDLYVHHSRIIHTAEHLLENELFGLPRLKVVWNRLEDLSKIVGGSAEMFWRGARPGHTAKMDKDASISEQDKEDFQQQLNEYEHDLRRWLRTQGVEITSLAPQVSDPTNHVDVQVSMISAATGIPKRILMGSERGELASSQDETNWNQNVQDRREQYADPAILRPLIDRLINYGILPEPKEGDYDVQWPDLFSPSEEEKAKTASNQSNAIKAYVSSPGANMIIPEKMFLTEVLGWPEEKADEAIDTLEGMAAEEAFEEAKDEGAVEEGGEE